MPRWALRRLVPQATPELLGMLDPARGPVEPPIRSEIFGLERFAQHGHSLAETHRAVAAHGTGGIFFPRLHNNIRMLRQAYRYIGLQAGSGYDVSPAAEWLLDNFHLIEARFQEIHDGLPRRYFRALPVLQDEPLAGLPRIYGVAWAFVAHTDGAFSEELLVRFLCAYQETRELTLGELWALPATLRVVLIEDLRRLAERVATNKAAREVANLCCDRFDQMGVAELDAVLALLNRRGVGRVFLAQIAQRLQGRRNASSPHYQEWLHSRLPELAAVQIQQPADQAADNLSVSNAVSSLRAISDADWPDIVSRTAPLMRTMLADPVFAGEDDATRDRTLHDIERLARRSGRSENAVAACLLAAMRSAPGTTADARCEQSRYWLRGAGAGDLCRRAGAKPALVLAIRRAMRRALLPAYLGAAILVTAVLTAWALGHPGRFASAPGIDSWRAGAALFGVLLLLFPASEAALAIINRLISESVRPRRLARLALRAGIPPEHRTMLVIPALLINDEALAGLTHCLLLHYLANPERHVQFALLTDHVDAATEHTPGDAVLLERAVRRVRQMNRDYPAAPGDPTRFLLLHRERQFSQTENCWIGWERKRGKLEQLLAVLAGGSAGPFVALDEISRVAPGCRYLITLDSDTRLPPGRLRELVGVAAHPDNQPRLDDSGRRVVEGYAILQPRVIAPLPGPLQSTLFHWLFAGHGGIDPYSAASSEVYQDVFDEGTFTGKGLLHVAAVHAVLYQKLPEGCVLSHDLIEGSIARCGTVTDIALVEDAPSHVDVAAARVHRWTRGDWQLLPFLLAPARHGLSIDAVNQWKMIDNLRRSLVAPASLAALVLALIGCTATPAAVIGLLLAASTAGPLMGAVAQFFNRRHDRARLHFYRHACADLARAACAGAWSLWLLPRHAASAVDAIVRALYRRTLSHRHLLQWTTAAAVAESASTRLDTTLREHRALMLSAVLLAAVLLVAGTPYPALVLLMGAAWALAPLAIWWASRPWPAAQDRPLAPADERYLGDLARDTWRFFERCVGPDDHELPPDNLQTSPYDIIAHRTSPTNIGLYLLSTACARRFGWIGTEDLLARFEATLQTLATLQRYRGHFLNWYDTQTCQVLAPAYVSTVDSGNLCGHLLATAQSCRALVADPYASATVRSAIGRSHARLLARLPLLGPASTAADAVRLLLGIEMPGDGNAAALQWELQYRPALLSAQAALPLLRADMPDGSDSQALPGTGEAPEAEGSAGHAKIEICWLAADHLNNLLSAARDVQARIRGADAAAEHAATRLLALAGRLETLAWQMDFRFLYSEKRRLLHIGFRVVDQQIDAGFYDLLASEARLTSLLAIAKGDVPAEHWPSLGRPYFAIGAGTGLRSWSGSMFEYLMPSLVLDEPRGSALREACRGAVTEQMAFAHARQVPWGISESAYAASDHTLAYQYAPQGVPRLALRRTPPDDLVVAPYATALAAQLVPHEAVVNFTVLEGMGARRRYGFIEAVDFTRAHQAGTGRYTRVDTFMSHHQGMSIVAIANVLFHGVARQWGMADAHIESVSTMLHEQAPRELPLLPAPAAAPAPVPLERRASGMLRHVLPGAAAVEPTHLLANGRYGIALRANGAGTSSWGPAGISRTRDDALRDGHGTFFYLRWDRQPQAVSLTQHPAPDPDAQYASVFHADRVCFDAVWPEVHAHMTAWVSPEDDIEFRRVAVSNNSERTIDFELLSCFEVTLSDPAADEAHPAFTNLFIGAAWLAAHQALLFERKPRLPGEAALNAAHFIAQSDPQAMEVRIQTDREDWLAGTIVRPSRAPPSAVRRRARRVPARVWRRPAPACCRCPRPAARRSLPASQSKRGSIRLRRLPFACAWHRAHRPKSPSRPPHPTIS